MFLNSTSILSFSAQHVFSVHKYPAWAAYAQQIPSLLRQAQHRIRSLLPFTSRTASKRKLVNCWCRKVAHQMAMALLEVVGGMWWRKLLVGEQQQQIETRIIKINMDILKSLNGDAAMDGGDQTSEFVCIVGTNNNAIVARVVTERRKKAKITNMV